MYIIFYNNKPIYLTNQNSICPNFESFDFYKIDLFEILNQLKNESLKGVCLTGKDVAKLYQNFIKKFKVIEAAGGLVQNKFDELLFIYRNEVWDLPKGKIEKGETKSQAALREVSEECGLSNLVIGDFFDTTYHIYNYNNKLIFKITYWYKMTCSVYDGLTPQLEEGITKVEFLDKNHQMEAIKNTYPNLMLLLHKYKNK